MHSNFGLHNDTISMTCALKTMLQCRTHGRGLSFGHITEAMDIKIYKQLKGKTLYFQSLQFSVFARYRTVPAIQSVASINNYFWNTTHVRL